MTSEDIIKELDKLPLTDKLQVIEDTLKKIRLIRMVKESNLKTAVNFLYNDYKNDKELTAFTALDNESFYESR